VERLRLLGLVDTSSADYVKCANPSDRDYKFLQNRSCRGRIRTNDALDDAADSFHCPECGRTVYPRQKARHNMIHVTVRRDGVAAHIVGLLDGAGISHKQVHPWVWRADMSGGETKLVVADYCDKAHLSRDWAVNNKACYIVVDGAGCKQRFLPEPWLVWTQLAQIVCQPDALRKLLSSAAVAEPTSSVRAAVPVYSATVRPIMDGEGSGKSPDANESSIPEPKARPDPARYTTAKCWTTKKDGAFNISTKTQSRHDGEVKFAAGTGQARLMQLLCYQQRRRQDAENNRDEEFETPRLGELLAEVYPDEITKARKDGNALALLLKRLRSMVSDIRIKKLEPAGINPDILPALNIEAGIQTGLSLRLARLHDLDEKATGGSKGSVDPHKLDYLRREEPA